MTLKGLSPLLGRSLRKMLFGVVRDEVFKAYSKMR